MTKLPEIQQADWQFPPNQEGAEYGFGDAASAHFRADPMAHLVREMIQNAMDAKLDGLAEPVHVAFSESEIPSSVIGGDRLRLHIESCLLLAKEKKLAEAAAAYSKALEILDQPTISCLSVIDSGTTA